MKSLPVSIDLKIPGFEKKYIPKSDYTLAPRKRNPKNWYNEFIDKIIRSCGKKYLPIVRIGDGEFLFILGDQPLDIRHPIHEKIRHFLIYYKWKLLLGGGISAFTVNHYHSGDYSKIEWKQAQKELPSLIKNISEKGILAPMTMYSREPFSERYFPAFDNWLQENNITFNDNNYYPQYFIYSAFTGLRKKEILDNRKVLVINGEDGDKKTKIISGLKKEGVKKVYWVSISKTRSYFDEIDINPFIGKIDLAVVGAGIGKFNIFSQLEDLRVPCIDSGFIFEVWADPKNKWERACCANDEDYKKAEELR